MKPTDLNSKAIPRLEELKEGVCDSLINLTFKRVSGFGPSGAVVFGRKPSRHFVSGFLLPGFDPTGEDDETSDIRINTHGLDFALSNLEPQQCTVSGTVAVYVRGLPEWEELTDKRYGMTPIFQPTAELRRKLKSAVRNRLDAWRKNRGQSASYPEYLNAKQEAYSAECRLVGLPAPNVDLEEVALQPNAQEVEETRNDDDLDEADKTPEDAIYAQVNTSIPDHLADAIPPPDIWVRIPVALGPWTVDLAPTSAHAQISFPAKLILRSKNVCLIGSNLKTVKTVLSEEGRSYRLIAFQLKRGLAILKNVGVRSLTSINFSQTLSG